MTLLCVSADDELRCPGTGRMTTCGGRWRRWPCSTPTRRASRPPGCGASTARARDRAGGTATSTSWSSARAGGEIGPLRRWRPSGLLITYNVPINLSLLQQPPIFLFFSQTEQCPEDHQWKIKIKNIGGFSIIEILIYDDNSV